MNLADPKAAIEVWRIDYNTVGLHSSLHAATRTNLSRPAREPRRLKPVRVNDDHKLFEPLARFVARAGASIGLGPFLSRAIASADGENIQVRPRSTREPDLRHLEV